VTAHEPINPSIPFEPAKRHPRHPHMHAYGIAAIAAFRPIWDGIEDDRRTNRPDTRLPNAVPRVRERERAR
jgi:hypothetical protein